MLTNTRAAESTTAAEPAEHVDVLVVGAGLSGIGAARRLQEECPQKDFLVLEGRSAIGGTWDLFRYPGVRSDSDMYTLSYPFRPWCSPTSIGDGASIRRYIADTAAETGIDRRVRFRHRVVAARWSSEEARWRVEVRVGDDAQPRTYTCSFLYACVGYYDYERGHRPEFPGEREYAGQLVHPQFWPDDLDCTGRRVVVIGSGATSVTVVPAIAERAAHVTMLQRSPSYLLSLPREDPAAYRMLRYLPTKFAHQLVRTRKVVSSTLFYHLCRRRPDFAKRLLRRGLVSELGSESYVDEHFTPDYQPWDQRLCVVPDSDFFRAVNAGAASVVTGHIDRFVRTGIRLTSGKTLDADLVVTATGLSLIPFGGIDILVDGEPVDTSHTTAYRGVLLSDVPNFAFCLGYTNASWTLRADLSSRYVCRLLNHLDRHGLASATPRPVNVGTRRPVLELDSNYVKRAAHTFPERGSRGPWTMRQDYLLDSIDMRRADLQREMTFTRARTRALVPLDLQEAA